MLSAGDELRKTVFLDSGDEWQEVYLVVVLKW